MLNLYTTIFFALAVLYLLSGLDDLLIDVVAVFRRLKPTKLSPNDLKRLADKPQKKIAIMVPAWKEGNIIRQMLSGNIRRIEYDAYTVFVGVYPNDPETRAAVDEASRENPRVVPVLNSLPGPTSKGQMLNQVIKKIFEYEKTAQTEFDLFLMQDSEDVIHPKMLALVNTQIEHGDFIQTPVLSLEVARGQLVASSYCDEFAEHHTKDMLVRDFLQTAIPSAGVGTALSRRLLLKIQERFGYVFHEKSLTEDYELGVNAHRLGLRSRFVCCYADGADFVATREYFPKKFVRSIKQKTRWSVGICLQGWRHLGWSGSWRNRYFLFRDRKGLVTNLVVLLGYPALLIFCASPEVRAQVGKSPFWSAILIANAALMLNRLVQRGRCVARVYGGTAVLGVPFSWLVGNVVNSLSSLNAIRKDIISNVTKKSHTWVKTEHELPEFFGTTVQSES